MAEENKQRPKDRDQHQESDQPQVSQWGTFLWLLFAVLLAVWIWQSMSGVVGGTQISYTKFLEQLEAENIERVVVKGNRIQGNLSSSAQKTTPDGGTTSFQKFVTHVPDWGGDNLESRLQDRGVEVEVQPGSEFSWWPILLGIGPVLLLLAIGYIFFRRMQTQGSNIFSIGKSGAEPKDREEVDTTFEDVAGAEGAKQELDEIIKYLRQPEYFERLGGEVPKGILMVGPPGTGKTLLARAVAGEADVPFFSLTGSDFMEMFVGVGASRVRDLFKKAKDQAPSIIFIDELDSIGRRRGAGLGGGHDEREQTLNQLLSEMDGFDPHESVIIMAATNRPDILDKALLRPGRFDRRISVDMPTQGEREEILAIHAKNKPMADDVDLHRLAQNTPGFSGADLQNLLNEGALIAARRAADEIRAKDIDDARDKIMMGLERKGLVITDEERELLAYHEAGHAIVAALMPTADPIHKVTIVPRGKAMGVTQQLPEKEQYIYQKEYMLDRLAVMMGGRAAEDLIFETSTSGAENDLKQVTKLARKMVLDWGMSQQFRNMALGGDNGQVFLGDEIAHQREYSEATAREIDEEIKSLLEASYEKAIGTLKTHREALNDLAELLIEEEEVAGDKVMDILRARGVDIKRKNETDVEKDGEMEDGGVEASEEADDDGEVESVSSERGNSQQH
jgi:cell division protease FtsH